MMKKTKFFLAIVSGLMVLWACEDTVLNLEDPSGPTDVNFFETEAELEVALTGIYESLAYLLNGSPFPQVLDLTTDYSFNRGDVSGTVAATTGGLTSTEGLIQNFWRQFYEGVQRANNLLNNMNRAEDSSDPARFAEIRGEALFLRALFYSYLTELYGDVPFRTQVATINDLIVPKSTKQEVVTAILADLEEVASLLPEVQPASGRGRASANTANGLISRIALYNGDYALAEEAALRVMNSGANSLYPNYEELFTRVAAGNSETLLEMLFNESVQVHRLSQRQGTRFGGFSQFVPAQQTVDSYETINGLPIDEDPAFDPANPFENRDPRLKASIVTPQAVWSGFIYEQHSDSIATWRVEGGVNVERVLNRNSANPPGQRITDPVSGERFRSIGANRFTSFTGYCWKKFSDEPLLAGEGSPRMSVQPIYLMRYAEILLNYAEAKIENGTIDGSVLSAINSIRERAYNGSGISAPLVTTMDQAELRRVVRRERKIELTNEGLRLFDIRRWRTAEKELNTTLFGSPANGFSKIGGDLGFVPSIDEDGFVTYDGAPSQRRSEQGNLDYREVEVRIFDAGRHYLWPIPQEEIDASNGAVVQNPGY